MSEVIVETCDPAHALQCLEIWGGSGPIHETVSVPGIDLWISSDPCCGDPNGGDIYFVSVCGCQQVSRFVVADVAGHGGAAGKLAKRLRQLMRKHIGTADQTRFAQALNREFSDLARNGRFATALLATYVPQTDHLVFCNAGHPPPIWYRAATQSWAVIRQDIAPQTNAAMNVPLGVIKLTDYVQFAIPLAKDDLVLIYSDSLIEARDPQGRMLGEEGFLDLLRGLHVGRLADFGRAALEAAASFRGGIPANDDMTLLVLHHNAANPKKLNIGQKLHVIAKIFASSVPVMIN
ncbi:MAG: PP2C family protein-serine/threonine phosphatase [Tepidisphaeraceae bacterium]